MKFVKGRSFPYYCFSYCSAFWQKRLIKPSYPVESLKQLEKSSWLPN